MRSLAVQLLRSVHRAAAPGPLGTRGLRLLYALNDRIAPRRPVVTRVAGSRMALDLREPYSRSLFYRGVADVEEYRAFCQAISRGMTVVDVGANIGFFTLAAARLVGPSGKVVAFEPLPRNYRYLVTNLALNRYDHAHAELMAVGDKDGVLELKAFARDNLSISPRVAEDKAQSTVTVPCCGLDTYCRAHGLEQVDVVKIDVEGAEAFVLEGMEALLQQVRPPALVMELHPEFLESLGRRPEDLLRWLESRSYGLWRLDGRGPTPVRDVASLRLEGEAARGLSRKLRLYARATVPGMVTAR